MKNTILCGALFTLVCANAQAENQVTAATTTTPATQPTTQGTQPATPIQAQPATTPAAQPAAINCDLKIPASTKVVDQTTVLTWSEKATAQAFDFDPTKIDEQMKNLQKCFTEQGWTGFNNALQKSGNLESIKAQKLTVSSQIDGQATMDEAKGNQWKLSLPLQVVYQNDKEKVTQLLSIKLTVGRKVNGDLGITQMIATPRTNTATNTATPNDTTKAPTTATPNGTPTTPTTGEPALGNPAAQPSNDATKPVDQQPATTTTTPNP